MNFDFLKQNFTDNTLNEFTYRSPFRNMENYNDFKTILNNVQYGPIRKKNHIDHLN